jgi:hypothetical protein
MVFLKMLLLLADIEHRFGSNFEPSGANEKYPRRQPTYR